MNIMSNVDNNNNETGRIAGISDNSKETVSVPKETVSVPKETVSVPKETASVPKETVSVPKETASVPKETVSVPKETDNLKQISLIDVDITDENVALNVIIGYLGVAQKRGTFAINESAKIYECVKKFTSN